MCPANKPEKVPDKEELKKLPSKRRKCLGCNDGYVWNSQRNRKLKCKGCGGSGYMS